MKEKEVINKKMAKYIAYFYAWTWVQVASESIDEDFHLEYWNLPNLKDNYIPNDIERELVRIECDKLSGKLHKEVINIKNKILK